MAADYVDKIKESLTKELRLALNELNINTLKELLKSSVKNSSPRATLIQAFEKAVLKQGVTRFVTKISRQALKSACDACAVSHARQRNLVDEILRVGVVEFLHEKCTTELLKSFCDALGLNTGSTNSSEMEQEIADEVMLQGTEEFLQNLNIDILRTVCEELKISTQGDQLELVEIAMMRIFNLYSLAEIQMQHSSQDQQTPVQPPLSEIQPPTQPTEIELIMEEVEPTSPPPSPTPTTSPPAPPTATPTNNKRKSTNDLSADNRAKKKAKRQKYIAPPLGNIKKGITKEDLHNLYNVTDLQEFCKKEGLDHNGKKSLVIKRILNYLETGEKPAKKPGKKGKKGSKKKGSELAESNSDKPSN